MYRFDGSDGIEEATLTASDQTEGAYFGNAIAVGTPDSSGGDEVVVGALNDDHDGVPFLDDLGAVYAY